MAERAISRLRHQEMAKQKNLESIIDQTIPKIEEERSIDDDVDKDWLSHFFESCATISEEKVQALWSDVLASKIAGRNLPRKVVDCLRWMDQEAARQFFEIAHLMFLFGGSFTMIPQQVGEEILSLTFGYDTDALIDIGLIKENLNKTFGFTFASLNFDCRELSDRSLEFRKFFEFTQTGKKLASVVVPSIRKYQNEISDGQRAYGVYSEKQFNLENEIMPAEDRIETLCGGILWFLIDDDAAISISKSLVKIKGKDHFDDSKEVMSVSTQNGKLVIRMSKRGHHWKALSDFEKSSLVRLAETLRTHAKAIERRPKPIMFSK